MSGRAIVRGGAARVPADAGLGDPARPRSKCERVANPELEQAAHRRVSLFFPGGPV